MENETCKYCGKKLKECNCVCANCGCSGIMTKNGYCTDCELTLRGFRAEVI